MKKGSFFCPCLGMQGARVAVPILMAITLSAILIWRPEVGGRLLGKEWPASVAQGRYRLDIVDRAGTILAYTGPSAGGEPSRFYPYDPVMTPVIGFIDRGTGRGLSGIEFQYDSLLSVQTNGPLPYRELCLTLDRDLQFQAYGILKETAARTGARKGTLLIMDTKDGAILALDQIPSPDADLPYSAVDPMAVSSLFHPVVLAGTQSGQPGPINPRLKWVDVDGMIRLLLPHDRRPDADWATIPTLIALGFGQKTGLDLPGEKAGCIAATSARGLQLLSKIEATPIQIIRSYAMIVNGGRPIQPHLRQGEFHALPTTSSPMANQWEYLGSLFPVKNGGVELLILAKREMNGHSMVALLALYAETRRVEQAIKAIPTLRRVLEFATTLPAPCPAMVSTAKEVAAK